MVSKGLQVVYVLPSVHSFKVWIHQLSVIWGLVPWVPPCPWSGSWVLASSCAHVATCQNIPIKPELELEYMHVYIIYTYQLYWSVYLLYYCLSDQVTTFACSNTLGMMWEVLASIVSLARCNDAGRMLTVADFLQDWTVEFFNFQSISEKMLLPLPPKTKHDLLLYLLQQPHFKSALYNVWLF